MRVPALKKIQTTGPHYRSVRGIHRRRHRATAHHGSPWRRRGRFRPSRRINERLWLPQLLKSSLPRPRVEAARYLFASFTMAGGEGVRHLGARRMKPIKTLTHRLDEIPPRRRPRVACLRPMLRHMICKIVGEKGGWRGRGTDQSNHFCRWFLRLLRPDVGDHSTDAELNRPAVRQRGCHLRSMPRGLDGACAARRLTARLLA